MSEKKDWTVLAWSDRKVVVEHVTMTKFEAITYGNEIASDLGRGCDSHVVLGHLPVHLNERTNPS